MVDLNVSLKAVLLKYVGLDKLEDCFNAVKFQIECVLRTEISEKIKTMGTDMMIAILEEEGYTVTHRDDENVG